MSSLSKRSRKSRSRKSRSRKSRSRKLKRSFSKSRSISKSGNKNNKMVKVLDELHNARNSPVPEIMYEDIVNLKSFEPYETKYSSRKYHDIIKKNLILYFEDLKDNWFEEDDKEMSMPKSDIANFVEENFNWLYDYLKNDTIVYRELLELGDVYTFLDQHPEVKNELYQLLMKKFRAHMVYIVTGGVDNEAMALVKRSEKYRRLLEYIENVIPLRDPTSEEARDIIAEFSVQDNYGSKTEKKPFKYFLKFLIANESSFK